LAATASFLPDELSMFQRQASELSSHLVRPSTDRRSSITGYCRFRSSAAVQIKVQPGGCVSTTASELFFSNKPTQLNFSKARLECRIPSRMTSAESASHDQKNSLIQPQITNSQMSLTKQDPEIKLNT